jgi:NAD(P)-dependent dehydrogenase (short-subunit alcohol dehydrogenase family)
VWLNGRSAEVLEACVEDLHTIHGDRIVGFSVADVREPADVESMWAEASLALGKVELWINNAGVAAERVAPALEVELGELRRPIEVNLLGTLNCLHIIGRHMAKQGGGSVYVMEGFGSDGKRTQEGLSAYGASKAGLRYLTRSLRKEWKGSSLRLGRISPGMVVTRLLLGPYGAAGPPPDVRKVFDLFADRPEIVAPFIAQQVEAGDLDVVWLTTSKLLGRILLSPFRKRDVLLSRVG